MALFFSPQHILAPEDFYKSQKDHGFKGIIAAGKICSGMQPYKFCKLFSIMPFSFFERPGRPGPPSCDIACLRSGICLTPFRLQHLQGPLAGAGRPWYARADARGLWRRIFSSTDLNKPAGPPGKGKECAIRYRRVEDYQRLPPGIGKCICRGSEHPVSPGKQFRVVLDKDHCVAGLADKREELVGGERPADLKVL